MLSLITPERPLEGSARALDKGQESISQPIEALAGPISPSLIDVCSDLTLDASNASCASAINCAATSVSCFGRNAFLLSCVICFVLILTMQVQSIFLLQNILIRFSGYLAAKGTHLYLHREVNIYISMYRTEPFSAEANRASSSFFSSSSPAATYSIFSIQSRLLLSTVLG